MYLLLADCDTADFSVVCALLSAVYFDTETSCCFEHSVASVQRGWESYRCIPRDAVQQVDDDAIVTRWTEETYSVRICWITLSSVLQNPQWPSVSNNLF